LMHLRCFVSLLMTPKASRACSWTVFASPGFSGDDPKRSVAAYTALKERIWADVHARGHENPLAPLLKISELEEPQIAASTSVEMPFVEERVAIEALRAGVPNRAAIRLLRTSEGKLSERFSERLNECRAGLRSGRVVEGEIVAGGFGTGKSHLLGFLADQALRENFIVSPVAISKETPLFDLERLFAAAIRNAIVPEVNDDVMTAVVSKLDPNACDELEKWATEQQSPLFAALMFLLLKQVITTEDVATIARFFGGSKLNVSKVRQWLRAAGALSDARPVKAPQLALQCLRFGRLAFARPRAKPQRRRPTTAGHHRN
jgi:hypothetical protein